MVCHRRYSPFGPEFTAQVVVVDLPEECLTSYFEAAESQPSNVAKTVVKSTAPSIRKISLMIELVAPYVLHRRAVSCARNQPQTLRFRRNATEEGRKVPMVKTFDDMQKTSNANVDATVQSFEGVTKATQAIATEIANYSKRSFEHGAKTMENLLGAKSLDRAFEVQTEYAKGAYEDYVSEVTKLSQLYSDLAREAFKPYQSFAARVTPTR
jgi:hypothetical protein